MDEEILIINRISEVLDIAEGMENLEERNGFLQECAPEINEFKDDLNNILRAFQFRRKGNKTQNDVVDKVKDNIIRLLNIKGFFEKDDQYLYYKSDLIDALSNNENRHAFRLQYENNMENVESALEYLLDREDYIEALKANNMFENQALNESAAKAYIANGYEKNMLGHALISLKTNFMSIPKEDIVVLLNQLDKSSIVKEILTKDSKKMDFYDQNLVYQYCDTILKMKSIFTPEKFPEDIVIKQFWKGKISDSKTISSIIANCSANDWFNLYKYEEEHKTNGFIKEISNHFSNVNMSNENIAAVMKSIFKKDYIPAVYAEFLAQIDLPDSYGEFMESEHSAEYRWLQDISTFESLKESEKIILEARMPFVPVEYYVKRLDKLSETPNLDWNFVENLITLIHTDICDDEEKAELTSALKRNASYEDHSNESSIEFNENDSTELIMSKANLAYNRRQTIPIEIALKLVNEDLSNSNKLDKTALKACVQSIIVNNLKENNVEELNGVYFGNGNGCLNGFWNTGTNALWLDNTLLENYINANDMKDKANLFETMFHEMQHAIQFNLMKKGEMNYLTYNFIKEEIISSYDEKFYKNNYKNIYIEADARKEEVLGAMSFLKKLNPEFLKTIRKDMENQYIMEVQSYNLYTNAEKNFPIGKEKTVDISEYVGRLIQDNPRILEENPILACEYNQDGSQKDIKTLLSEFEEKRLNEDADYKNLYSIYYGLINRAKDTIQRDDIVTKQKLDQFMDEETKWITYEDMQNMYKSVDSSKVKDVFARLRKVSRSNCNIEGVRNQNDRDCR